MPRSTAPKEQPQQQDDAVSLIGEPAAVEQPGPSQEIVIGEVASKPAPEPQPQPTVVISDSGDITIK